MCYFAGREICSLRLAAAVLCVVIIFVGQMALNLILDEIYVARKKKIAVKGIRDEVKGTELDPDQARLSPYRRQYEFTSITEGNLLAIGHIIDEFKKRGDEEEATKLVKGFANMLYMVLVVFLVFMTFIPMIIQGR